METYFRKATIKDRERIWAILQQAIIRRREEGSQQWQDGYPNADVVRQDIENDRGYVLMENESVVAYCAISDDEPAYLAIDGKWLTSGAFLVVHRVAVAGEYLGKGLAKAIFRHVEDLALKQGIPSIKVDTNFDNLAMIGIFEKLGYSYCGEVYFRGNARRAYEKVLS